MLTAGDETELTLGPVYSPLSSGTHLVRVRAGVRVRVRVRVRVS